MRDDSATGALMERVSTTLAQLGGECPLEEVMDLCPELTWNQVFLAIDHLSRKGQVRVTVDTSRTYWVQAAHPGADECAPSMSGDAHTGVTMT